MIVSFFPTELPAHEFCPGCSDLQTSMEAQIQTFLQAWLPSSCLPSRPRQRQCLQQQWQSQQKRDSKEADLMSL